MLKNAKNIRGASLRARDGDIGEVDDLYFDNQQWTIRYFVVETGAWLKRRKVLLTPEIVRSPVADGRMLPVDLTKEQVRNSPGDDLAHPISREYETRLRDHYGWPPYWTGAMTQGVVGVPMIPPTPAPNTAEPGLTDGFAPPARAATGADPHLQSVARVIGSHIAATDGAIGHVDDVLFEDATWTIRYLVVDTTNWWPGGKVIVSPAWIREIDWANSRVVVDLSKEAIKGSPAYDPSKPVDSTYAGSLHDYYHRPRYSDWETTRSLDETDVSRRP